MEKGVAVVEVYRVINWHKFSKEREKCEYYHLENYVVDADMHCAQKYGKKYKEGQHKRCVACSPENCIVPGIIQRSIRSQEELIENLVQDRLTKLAEYNQKIANANKVIEEMNNNAKKCYEELPDILNANFNYSPAVKRILQLAKKPSN